jgi:hypothetical protein
VCCSVLARCRDCKRYILVENRPLLASSIGKFDTVNNICIGLEHQVQCCD